MDADDSQFFLNIFRDEADTCLKDLRESLRALYRDPEDTDALERGYRAAHTIKGSAGLLKLGQVANLAREVEDGLRRAYNGLDKIAPTTVAHYARLADEIKENIP